MLEPFARQVEPRDRSRRRRDSAAPAAASRPWRSRQRPRSSRARPMGGRCSAPGSAGSSRPARSADGGRCGGQCTGMRRPRCSSGSRARRGPRPGRGSHRTPRPARRCSPRRPATARACAAGAAKARPCAARRQWRRPRRSDRRWHRSSTFAPGPTASATASSGVRMRRYRRAIPPSSGEPCTWLTRIRPRSCWCSMANTQPLGRTLSDRPDGLVMRTRPRSLSLGVIKVRAARGLIS